MNLRVFRNILVGILGYVSLEQFNKHADKSGLWGEG
jgi:hypothetical protein